MAVVLLDRDFHSYPLRSDFDLVGIDNYAAGFLLAQHLLKLGQTRLAYLAHRFSAPTIAARIAGAKSALEAAGVTVPKDFAHYGNPEDISFVRNLVAGRQLDGIICGNDFTAAQLLNSLAKIKVRVPEDLRVVGCDDLRYAQIMREPLTTVSQPMPRHRHHRDESHAGANRGPDHPGPLAPSQSEALDPQQLRRVLALDFRFLSQPLAWRLNGNPKVHPGIAIVPLRDGVSLTHRQHRSRR